MNIYVPDTKEIHMIAFITMRGWKLDYDGRYWEKEGFTRNKKCSHPCGCCQYDSEIVSFTTEQAYDEEFYGD